jgi:predicted ATPase
MIKEIQIKNYKSISELKLPLGRVNVFIGENGAGKSNILEVVALAGAAAAEKLDHEFLSSRGIRVTKPEFMRPAFPDADPLASIEIGVQNDSKKGLAISLSNDNTPYSKWNSSISSTGFDLEASSVNRVLVDWFKVDDPSEKLKRTAAADNLGKIFLKAAEDLTNSDESKKNGDMKPYNAINIAPEDISYHLAKMIVQTSIKNSPVTRDLADFVIFSPENSALRTFDREGQIEPLGINGEGVLKLLSFYATKANDETLTCIKQSLKLFNWFDDFETESVQSDARLLISDRFLSKTAKGFDHRGTNEGFFFLLFYFLLLNSDLTPPFFAIDNIDASLNPKLCEKLMREIGSLAKKNNKQAILTTHNPAILDGLNLNDDEQRLFVISRGQDGKTKIKRISKPEPIDGKNPPRLSELFIRGLIGGLPKGF